MKEDQLARGSRPRFLQLFEAGRGDQECLEGSCQGLELRRAPALLVRMAQQGLLVVSLLHVRLLRMERDAKKGEGVDILLAPTIEGKKERERGEGKDSTM